MINYPKVSVVILNWNGIDFLRSFLPSVVANTYPNVEIVVGDNASTDGSVDFLRDAYPEITIITNDNNYGFAGGYNKVLTQVNADYFVLLNSDVEVDQGWVEPVIDMMERDSQIAAAQPKVRSFKNKDSFEYAGAAGGFMDKFGYPFCRGRIFDTVERDESQYDEPSEIFWASGAALFIRKDRWIEMGGLDEDFFAHMEEIDLCWRLKNGGYKIMYCPASKVYHVGGGTLNSENPYKTYLNFRNNLVLIQKNYSFGQASYVIFCRLWLDFLALLKFVSAGKMQSALAISKAHRYFFAHIFKNAKKARAISTNNFNNTGLLDESIVWQYFVNGKKKFSLLKKAFQR